MGVTLGYFDQPLTLSWKAHITNEQLKQPKVSDKIKKRHLQFAGHCLRSSGQVVSDLVLWKPVHGKRGAGRPIMTYVDLLCQDTRQTPAEIKNLFISIFLLFYDFKKLCSEKKKCQRLFIVAVVLPPLFLQLLDVV